MGRFGAETVECLGHAFFASFLQNQSDVLESSPDQSMDGVTDGRQNVDGYIRRRNLRERQREAQNAFLKIREQTSMLLRQVPQHQHFIAAFARAMNRLQAGDVALLDAQMNAMGV